MILMQNKSRCDDSLIVCFLLIQAYILVKVVMYYPRIASNVHSFIFVSAFPLGGGDSSSRRTRNTSRFSAIWDSFCRLDANTGPSKVGDVVTPTGPWTTSELPSLGFSQQEILDTLPNQRSWDLSIEGELVWHSGFYGFHNYALCREVSHRERFANIPSLPFVLLAVFFQLSPKIYDNGWGSEQWSI